MLEARKETTLGMLKVGTRGGDEDRRHDYGFYRHWQKITNKGTKFTQGSTAVQVWWS